MILMKVSVYCLEIVAATGITCSDEEKESLKVFFFHLMMMMMMMI